MEARSNSQSQPRPLKQVNFSMRHEIHAIDLEDTNDASDSFSASSRPDLWTTILMLCLLLIGIGCGLAHHAFNSYLDGRLTTSFDQAWAIRIGTALAMGLKTALLASMGMAFAQQVWRSVRRSTLSVKALDSLFGAFGGDPRSLFQADLYRSASLALVLAILAWLLPIVTVFTPATLRIKPIELSSSSSCLVSTLALANITDGGLIRYPSPDGRYRGPSSSIRRIAFQSLLSGSFAHSTYYSGPAAGINVTYALSLVAPALECSEQKSTTQIDPNPQQDTFWQGIRSDVRDSNSGQNVPMLQVLYTSNPRTQPPIMLSCAPYISYYGIMVSHNATDQTVSLLNLTMVSPAGRPAGSVMNLINDDPLLTGAAALIDATFDILTGNLTQDRSGNLLSPSSNAALASFISPTGQTSFNFVDVSDNVKRLMQNVVISTIGLGIFQTGTTCFALDRVNVYLYDQSVLINAYVAVVCIAIATLGIGIYALRENGHPGDTSFSGIVLATRNPTLDHICQGGRRRLLAFKIKFGLLRSDGRPAFGEASDFH
ncbi:unnamed protein product [Rhizoctonia solani]|uniref:Uncharacterized protein n=1 Tax=Rhizoctonia solani TaxID=456999 RepID=A0A8H2WCH8_9AGAM|nr:unnamed protein product [Rhizoctonia solani]